MNAFGRWIAQSKFNRYAGALAGVGVAILVRLALDPLIGRRFPLVTITVAMVLSARYFGAGPTMVAACAGSFASSFIYNEWSLVPGSESFGLVSFLGLSFLVSWVMEALRDARQVADDQLRRLHAEQRFAAQLRAIVESSDDAIISVDLNGCVLSWNRAAENMFGYTAEEVSGMPISMLAPQERLREQSEAMALIRNGGRVKPFETFCQRRDGSQLQMALAISPIRQEDGSLSGASFIARDITERKQVEQRLTQTQKLESLGVLAGGLAHDFNNLLTGIMGNASLALSASVSATTRERIAEVILASERAAILVSQMLAYAGKGSFVIERLDISQQVREIVPLIRGSIPQIVGLDLQLTEGLPLIEADRSQIQQLVMNLIINAAEAIGGQAGSVVVATGVTGTPEFTNQRRVIFEVKDDGCGMDEATKARIFDPFFTTKFTGRGLGLAAVLGIIRAHRGEISVDSAPGRGSVFRVAFPLCEETDNKAMSFPA